jgi:hypothetical protein
MKSKYAAAAAALAAAALAAGAYGFSAVSVRRLSAVISFFTDNKDIVAILGSLSRAEVKPPLWLPALCGIASAAVIYAAFSLKRKHGALVIRISAIIAAAVITVFSFAGTLYLTKVNSVPFGTAGRILLDIAESGLLE